MDQVSAATQAIPLVVNLKRLRLINQKYCLDGAASLSYGVASSKEVFELKTCDKNEPAIAIDMYSLYVAENSDAASQFLACDTFATFLELFQKQDIALLVMLCAVGHPPYPPSALPPKNITPVDFNQEEDIAKETASSVEFKVNLNTCSQTEYKKLHSLAKRYGFFRNEGRYLKFDAQTKSLRRSATHLPLVIDHIYSSTPKDCDDLIAALQAKKESLALADDEALGEIINKKDEVK